MYYLRLDPDNEKIVKELAESDKNFKTFEFEINKIIKKFSKRKLLNMFNESIHPYLIQRYDIELTNQRGKLYFGHDSEKGLIDELLSGTNSGELK